MDSQKIVTQLDYNKATYTEEYTAFPFFTSHMEKCHHF